MTFPPEQMLLFPALEEIETVGTVPEFTFTASEATLPFPQVFVAWHVIFPEFDPKLTTMLLVP